MGRDANEKLWPGGKRKLAVSFGWFSLKLDGIARKYGLDIIYPASLFKSIQRKHNGMYDPIAYGLSCMGFLTIAVFILCCV
jgi:hypothetical protein